MTLNEYVGLSLEETISVNPKDRAAMLKKLRDEKLVLPVYHGFMSDFYKNHGAIILPDYEGGRNAKWRLYVPDYSTKAMLAKAIREHKKMNGHPKGFTAADLKKPAMCDSNGKFKTIY